MTTETVKIETPAAVGWSAWFCVPLSFAETGIVIWAVSTDMPGPGNIVKLFAILNAVLWPVALYAGATSKDRDNRKPWLKHWMTCSDIVQTLILCWCGWWWCSTAYALGAFGSSAVRYRKGKTQNVQARPGLSESEKEK